MAFCLSWSLSTLDFKAVLKGPLPAGGFQAPVTVASSISSVSLSIKKRGLDTKRDDLTLEPGLFPRQPVLLHCHHPYSLVPFGGPY